MNGAMRFAYCALRTEDQFRSTQRSNVMVIVREKATVTQRVHGACATHSRTEISALDVEAVIDEPQERDGTDNGPTATEPVSAALKACTNLHKHKCAT